MIIFALIQIDLFGARRAGENILSLIVRPHSQNLHHFFLFKNLVNEPMLKFRISNFLLWQISYSEIHITDVLWPDFRSEHLNAAIEDYQKRQRRFGGLSEDV